MKAHHRSKKSRLYLQEYLPPVTKKNDIEKNIKAAKAIIADSDTEKKSDKRNLREYTPPKIDVILVEMENGIAAGSGFALPVRDQTTVNETWDNKNITPDKPTYW
ncbi:hypothetical protein HZQ11_00805 [Elizabethkingia anophelis]|uniref:hypothetical protein n=1 Tax=Elizabethkingia TaxID=308865 RepID=UPI00073992A6|nr:MULTISPECIES: hypothetical protein [Elizabethkingia]KUF46291.1 hypothetical protein AS358_00040 [Elizabethkingia anophelis]MCT3643529.1 hypothetical protein [Elizabethkingia anophelis]MCT3650219.1 hypothetical protein [Elizabethkingia anophelis]MCT3653836.1 hypothetical protein [Elizabethkingia anophelis]MCT3657783.1 hypothetical protein [Elizabethkingia anophelis]